MSNKHRDTTDESQALERDVRAVFEKHRVNGVIIVATNEIGGWRPFFPKASGLALEGGKLRLKLQPHDEVGIERLLRFLTAMIDNAEEVKKTFQMILTDIEATLGITLEIERLGNDSPPNG